MLAQGTGIKGCGKQHDYHYLLLKDKPMVAPFSYKTVFMLLRLKANSFSLE
jgi:hypothetical protein